MLVLRRWERTCIGLRPLDHLAACFIERRRSTRRVAPGRITPGLGVGAAQLPLSLLSHDLAAGTLVSWGEMDAPEISLWALYPSRRLLSARVSAFLAYLKEAFPNGTPEELAAYIAG